MEQTIEKSTLNELASVGYAIISESEKGFDVKLIANDLTLKQLSEPFANQGIAIRHILQLTRMFSGGKVLVFVNTELVKEAFYLFSNPDGFTSKMLFDTNSVKGFDWEEMK